MPHIVADDVNAWFDPSRLALDSDSFMSDPEQQALESQIVTQVFARLAPVFDEVTSWTSAANTPKLVKSIIAMLFGAWLYDRTYSENAETEETTTYGNLLRSTAWANVDMLVAGLIALEELPTVNAAAGQPSFFPTDFSSSQKPTVENPEYGPAAFTMGEVF